MVASSSKSGVIVQRLRDGFRNQNGRFRVLDLEITREIPVGSLFFPCIYRNS